MTPTERKFHRRLDEFGNEARGCAAFVYTELAFHHWVSSDFELMDRVQPYAGFWNRVLGSFQASGIVALGRIYDTRRESWSADSLLTLAETNVAMFRPAALKARRVSAGATEAEADAYVLGSCNLRKGGLAAVRAEFQRCAGVYDKKFKPIRHQVFAHAGALEQGEKAKLFENLMVRDLEAVAIGPLRIHEALWQSFVNGEQPVLPAWPSNIVDVVRNLPAASKIAAAHQYAARDVREFLNWLQTGANPKQ